MYKFCLAVLFSYIVIRLLINYLILLPEDFTDDEEEV